MLGWPCTSLLGMQNPPVQILHGCTNFHGLPCKTGKQGVLQVFNYLLLVPPGIADGEDADPPPGVVHLIVDIEIPSHRSADAVDTCRVISTA